MLYSPAGLAELLILSYPDPRYKQWVGRLQIDWMMTRRGRLQVTDGLWKGITDDNLGLFHAEGHPELCPQAAGQLVRQRQGI